MTTSAVEKGEARQHTTEKPGYLTMHFSVYDWYLLDVLQRKMRTWVV